MTLQFDQKRNGYPAIVDAHVNLLTCKQGPDQTAEEFTENIVTTPLSITVGPLWKTICWPVPHGPTARCAQSTSVRQPQGRDQTLVMCVVRGCDKARYGLEIANLSNQYSKGRNEYRKDLNSTQSMLVNYTTHALERARNQSSSNNHNSQSAETQNTNSPAPEESALTFAQRESGGTPSGISSIDLPAGAANTMTASTSTASVHTGTTLVQSAVMLVKAEAATIDPSWVLLDSQSTMSVFRNKSMLSNIRQSPHVLRAITNGGYQDSNIIGDFPHMDPI